MFLSRPVGAAEGPVGTETSQIREGRNRLGIPAGGCRWGTVGTPWWGGCGWLLTAPERRVFLGRGCLESRHRVSYVELNCTDFCFSAQRRVCKGLPGPSPAPWHPRPLFTVVWEGRALRGSWLILEGLGGSWVVSEGLGGSRRVLEGLRGSWKILGGLGGSRGVIEDSVLGDAEVPRPQIWVKWQQHHP